jgi:hypothetical protein
MNVFYTNFAVPKGSAGCARGPLIFIRPEYKGDAGLLAHERVHVRQWLRTIYTLGLLHSLRYLLSDDYRLACEVEAYREQARHYPDDRLRVFAWFISRDYGLSITADEAYAKLKAAP